MRFLTALLCVAVFLGPAAAQSLKRGLSPCGLLTKVEAQVVMGAPVSEGAINATNKSIRDFKVGDAGSVVSNHAHLQSPR